MKKILINGLLGIGLSTIILSGCANKINKEVDNVILTYDTVHQTVFDEKDKIDVLLRGEKITWSHDLVKQYAAAQAKLIAAQKAKEQAAKTTQSVVVQKTENFDKNTTGNILFKLSFYTSLPEENGGYEHLANGQSVYTAQNVVASNYYKLGTKIYLEGFGLMTVSDRGGSSFNSSTRLDVLVQRKPGETDAQYKARAMALGRKEVYGYIVN